MVVLGLGFTDHEASAALVIDGELKTAIARERLTRQKRDGILFGSRKLGMDIAIQYCLNENGLKLSDVDLLVWNHVDQDPATRLTARLMLEESMSFSGIPLLVLPHHFAHACCSFYLSPFSEAAILVADGNGGSLSSLKNHCESPESESVRNGAVIIQNSQDDQAETARELESFYFCDGTRWTTLRKVVGDCDGIGARYGAVSSLLFENPLDAGKTMGLAPYGHVVPGPLFLAPRGPAEMPFFQATHGKEWSEAKGEIKSWRSTGKELNHEDELPSRFAATVQHEAEEAMLEYARWIHRATGAENLCLSGGVALNCVANSYLAREAGFTRVFVPPAPGDDGIAVGCALYGAAVRGKLRRGSRPVFLGRRYTHNADELRKLGLCPISIGIDSTDWTAERIAEGAVVAWYQGGAELGPRALGHRSLLADPRRSDMRDYLNKTIKKREPFRPFAPVILEEATLDWFEERYPSHFMSFVSRLREDKRDVVPAIAHIDGTARYQVLREADNPELYRLIVAFAKRTGVPMLLNTSFNRAGEPIVETPEEAACCMAAASIDYLILDGFAYARSL